MSDRDYLLKGTIYDKTGNPVSGLIIRVFDNDPHSGRDLLGTTVSDRMGKYAITYGRSHFARPVESGGADIIVLVFTPEGKQLYESQPHLNVPKRKTIDIHLRNYPAQEQTVFRSHAFSGSVVDEKGVGIVGLVIEAFALDSPTALRSGATLGGPVLSGEDGRFEIEISENVSKCRMDSPIDIALAVSDSSGKELSRTVHYDIATKKSINIVIPSGLFEQPSEFEKLGRAIVRHLERPDDLLQIKEDDEQQGVTYLSRKTRWDARLVGMYVLAQRYADDAVPAEFFYALYRGGVPSPKDAFYRVNVDKAMKLFEQAIEHHIIPVDDYDTAQIRAQFQARSNRHILTSKSPSSLSTMEEMLSLSLGTEEDRSDFVDLYYHGEGDLNSRWEKIEARFGDRSKAVRLDGQLGYMSLNNAGLIKSLKDRLELETPLDLVKQGFYEEDAWDEYLEDAAIPEAFTGDTVEERRTHYKQWMTVQLKRSYPTPVIAEKIRRGTISIGDGYGEDLINEVYHALYANGFVLGKDSVNRHIETLDLSVEARKELQRIHRTYQLSPSDAMMSRLLELKFDSAFKITRHDKEAFVMKFDSVEWKEASLAFDKAMADVSLITNTALGSYLQKRNPTMSVIGGSNAATVKTYPKLEELFGDLDYCASRHCESIFSPAAYFVDLLQFIDGKYTNPLSRLLLRRPDLEFIDLTCENTETVLPYVDLVNEILEYWISHNNKIEGFEGYNVGEDKTSEELLASPANVNMVAYETLDEAVFPLKLPFARNLELIRAYFDSSKTPLFESMEALHRGGLFTETEPEYGWREIFIEQLGLSPVLFSLLTDSGAHPVQTLFGYSGTNLDSEMPNAKSFCRCLGIEYDELLDLLKTRFINPDSREEASKIQPVSVDPEQELRGCSFETIKLGYKDGNILSPFEYLKLVRFVRLWKHLGWSIEQTDSAIEVLTGLGERLEEVGASDKLKTLDFGFEELIVKLALFERLQKEFNAKKGRDFEELLELWNVLAEPFADLINVIEDMQYEPLAKRLGMDKEELKTLHQGMVTSGLSAVEGYLQIAKQCNLTSEETVDAVAHSGLSTLDAYQMLADRLRLSLQELFDAIVLSGINPKGPVRYLDQATSRYREPDILRFIMFVQKIHTSKFLVSELNYLFRDKDVTGTDAPDESELFGLLVMLHDGLKELVGRYPIESTVSEEKARELLIAVYGEAGANIIAGIFSETQKFVAQYAHTTAELSVQITRIDTRLWYDDLKKELVYEGVMPFGVCEDLQNDALGVSDAFKAAIIDLYTQGKTVYDEFFQTYPEIAELYNPDATLGSVVSAKLPDLIERMQYAFAEQLLNDQLGMESEMAKVLLERDLEIGILHAASGTSPILSDFIALRKNGISASYYSEPAMTRASLFNSEERDAGINYGPSDPLPGDPDNLRRPIRALWQFYLMPEMTADCNLYLEASQTTDVLLSIDGGSVKMRKDELLDVWSNKRRISLEAGRAYLIRIEARNIAGTVVLRWKQGDRFKETLPVTRLFPYRIVQNYRQSYRRLLKVLQWMRGAALLPEEVRYFGREYLSDTIFDSIPVDGEPAIETVRKLCALFVDIADYNDLKNRLLVQDETLISFFRDPGATYEVEGVERSLLYKMVRWSKEDIDTVVRHFRNNEHLTETERELAQIALLRKTADVFALLQRTGMSADDMIAFSTPYPGVGTVTKMQEALRNRYDEDAWLKLSQTVHDKMRTVQRDALVAYILHELQKVSESKHIDTSDKLFEYFLIDVQMDACMKTSRIKQAISSVQLFIERCLHNLEPRIAPKDIDAKQWEWRKRYRVWEANRKVLLYPENWLDPSLRSTKSPFFKEFESELFQSDINDDLAAKALLNYLEKLDRVSQLEICGMCREYEEKEPVEKAMVSLVKSDGKEWSNRIHVIGKTAGIKREYYHRCYDGSWSAWEKITLDLEDGPVIPVFWKGRLFLFWTTVVQKGMENNEKKANPDNLENLSGPPKIKVEINLNWSEFYNGKWQDKRTSDFMNPIVYSVTGEFKQSDVILRYIIGDNNTLTVMVLDLQEYPQNNVGHFVFANTHAMPDRNSIAPHSTELGRRIVKNDGGRLVHNDYYRNSKQLLNNNFYNIKDFAHPVININEEPFFLNDYRHAFFVDPKKVTVPLQDVNVIGLGSSETLPHNYSPELHHEINDELSDLRSDSIDLSNDRMLSGVETMVSTALKGDAGFAFDGVMLGALGQNINTGRLL